MQTYIIVAVIAYFLGSIPFGYILVRLFKKQDVRTIGSGNIGATNVVRSGAKGLGIATLILDAAKGYAAVMIADALFAQHGFAISSAGFANAIHHNQNITAVAAIFAILGHMFPIWLRYKGGKGVATGVGVFLALAPKAVAIVLVIFIGLVWLSRYVSLGSIIATAAFPVIAWSLDRIRPQILDPGFGNRPATYLYMSPVLVVAMFVAALLIIARHHQNIRRLLAGTESRLGEKKKAEVQA
jgi:glycerol-3-phosphate acyltransferase PlsY